MVYVVGILSAATVAIALILRKRASLFEALSRSPDVGNTVSAGTNPDWMKKKEVKIALASMVGVPLGMLLVFGLLIPGGAGWMGDNWSVSVGIGVVVGLMVLATLIPFKVARSAAMLFLLVTLIVGVGLTLPWKEILPEAKTASAASAPADPFTKVIAEVEVPPGGMNGELIWSEKINLPDPDGPEVRIRPQKVPVTIRVLDAKGNLVPKMGIKDSRSPQANLQGLPKEWSIQAASLIPNTGGGLRFVGKQ